jgi:transcriptional antiterminator NusG
MAKVSWYAVHTMTQAEQRVVNYINKTLDGNELKSMIREVIIPTDIDTKRVGGKKVEKKVKVFPGYVLIRMEMSNESFNFIKRVPGVTSFVSANGKPVALKDDEIKNILEALDPNKGFKPKKKFCKDMVVRIVGGPFSDFTGKIESVNDDKELLKVMISLFGRDTPVEIEFGLVEKL